MLQQYTIRTNAEVVCSTASQAAMRQMPKADRTRQCSSVTEAAALRCKGGSFVAATRTSTASDGAGLMALWWSVASTGAQSIGSFRASCCSLIENSANGKLMRWRTKSMTLKA